MELLFPFSVRDDYIEQIRQKEITALDIAHKYMIPEINVIRVLSDQFHQGLKNYRNEWKDEMDNHIAGMPVPSLKLPPRND